MSLCFHQNYVFFMIYIQIYHFFLYLYNMKMFISEKQLELIYSQRDGNQEIDEQEAGTDPEAAKPTAGTSSTQTGGKGYPEVGKWESGVTRGPGNQVGVTKWADVVGANLKRGKGNPLK